MTKEVEKAVKEVEKAVIADSTSNGIEVGNPQELRPTELPLVIKPTSGKWENDAQAEFAAVLNGYAYKNPAKWAIKKDDTTVTFANGTTKVVPGLISQLAALGKNPSLIMKLRGGENDNLSYKDKNITN